MLVVRHRRRRQKFQISSPLEQLDQSKSCGASLGVGGGTKVYINGPRLPPRPYLVKTFKKLLLQNQKSYDLEASAVLGVQSGNTLCNHHKPETIEIHTTAGTILIIVSLIDI